jgi:hypothetical protein
MTSPSNGLALGFAMIARVVTLICPIGAALTWTAGFPVWKPS